MADLLFKPEALVPIWVEGSGISALGSMVQRPVLIDVGALGKVMRGQMLQVTTHGATVLPDDPFLLWKSVPVKVSFRFRDIVYAFSGMTEVTEAGHSIRFEFDQVTRQSLMILGKNLDDAGLLDAADIEQMFAEETLNAPHAALPAKKDKVSARIIKHEKPPGGRERRIHHRHEVDVEAKLAIVNSDCNLECSVLELSLGGCRVYTELPNSIEKNTQVEVQFVECGFPLRMPATIQVKSGVHILGLKYLPMSSRMRERLQV